MYFGRIKSDLVHLWNQSFLQLVSYLEKKTMISWLVCDINQWIGLEWGSILWNLWFLKLYFEKLLFLISIILYRFYHFVICIVRNSTVGSQKLDFYWV